MQPIVASTMHDMICTQKNKLKDIKIQFHL